MLQTMGVFMTKLITVSLEDLVDHTQEGLLELIEELWGNTVLEDIQYKPIAIVNGLIQLEVTANEYTEL